MLQCYCQITTTRIVIIALIKSPFGYRKYKSFKYKKIGYRKIRYLCITEQIFIADVYHVCKLNTVVSSVQRCPGKNTTSGNAACSICYILQVKIVFLIIPLGLNLRFSLKFKVFLRCILSGWNSPPLPTSDSCQWFRVLIRYVSRNIEEQFLCGRH